MKTEFKIVIETKKVNQIYSDPIELTEENKIPLKETEEDIHKAIKDSFKHILKNKDSRTWEELTEIFMETIDTPVEDWEQISDYGRVSIKVE